MEDEDRPPARERAEDTGIYMVADFIFKKIDKDKSGTIDPDELAEFLAGPGGMSAWRSAT